MLTADVIAGFSGSLLQKNFDGAVESPSCHFEWWTYFTSNAPKIAIAAPRRHAKSTACTLTYLLACMVFRERSYCLLISDTVSQAGQFLADVKKELFDNESIRSLFKIKEFIKDTEDDVIVLCEDGHMFRITARGSEQKLRGLKWNNKRPDLVICDDLENDEIVMNPDRREKFKRWFYGALIPCMAIHGIIRIVGTILHEDSLLNNLMPKESDRWTRKTPLKTWSEKKGPWLSFKYKAHNDNYTHILWPQMYPQEWFQETRKDYVERGIPDVYSQEFLNEPIDDSIAFFKKADFLAMDKQDKEAKMHYYITGDLAISEAERADYSVFVVAGVDENKHLHVKNVIRERLDGREIVDMILALQNLYNPELFGLEEMQVSKAIGPFLREEMIKTNIFPSMMLLKHKGKDKMTRARSIQARMRARSVKFDKSGEWYPSFEDELSKFPRATKDDQVDAFAYLGMMLDSLVEAPTKEEQEEEDYLDDVRESNSGDYGRSAICGY
jgi:predicted phage terminase large subunit-like protein